MKNVSLINFNRITNDGFIGFHNNVATAAATINLKDVKTQLDVYKATIRKFSDYTTSVAEATAKRDVSNQDSKRSKVFRNFRGLVKVLRNSLDQQRSALANEIWKYVKNHDNVGSIDQKSLTGILESVIANVQAVLAKEEYTELVCGSDLELAFNALQEVQGAFVKTNQIRAEERSVREETTSRNLRNDCVAAFRQLVNFIQYNVATKGDENCAAFIDKVNVFIADNRSLYKARAKARAKAKSVEKTTPPAEPDSLPATDTDHPAEGRIDAA